MDKIYLEDMVVRFSQGPDCCQKDDESQIIEIHSEDNGVGTFFWLKTDRWSFSEPDDLVKLAERVRAMEKTNNKYENGEVIYNNSTDNKSVNNKIKQAEYVDLGLPSGLKWAKCNVGAEKETDYGDYFMWGSTNPNTSDECTWANTPFNGGYSEYNADAFNQVKNTAYPNGILAKEYDTASQIMGSDWRMPTRDEFQELINNTDKEWTQVNGVNGRKFTSKTDESKYIFIPAAGFCSDGSMYGVGYGGNVWSSSLGTSSPGNVWDLDFGSVYCYMNFDNRCYGLSVRGVME